MPKKPWSIARSLSSCSLGLRKVTRSQEIQNKNHGPYKELGERPWSQESVVATDQCWELSHNNGLLKCSKNRVVVTATAKSGMVEIVLLDCFDRNGFWQVDLTPRLAQVEGKYVRRCRDFEATQLLNLMPSTAEEARPGQPCHELPKEVRSKMGLLKPLAVF